MQGVHRVAVIDIGTNSTRLLVADVEGGRVVEVERRSRVTRLGRGVDLSGQLSAEAIEAVCEAIAEYVDDLPRGAGRGTSTRSRPAPCATPPTAAPSSPSFASASRSRPGSSTARRRPGSPISAPPPNDPPTEPTLVIDIGGGSTELVVGTGEEIDFHASLQAGSSATPSATSPPTRRPGRAGGAGRRRQALIEAASPASPRRRAADAGSPSPARRPRWRRSRWASIPTTPSGFTATCSRCRDPAPALAARLGAALPSAAEIAGLHPDRAPTIVAGVVILIEAMRAFGLERVEVSEHDILYGAAIAAARTLRISA